MVLYKEPGWVIFQAICLVDVQRVCRLCALFMAWFAYTTVTGDKHRECGFYYRASPLPSASPSPRALPSSSFATPLCLALPLDSFNKQTACWWHVNLVQVKWHYKRAHSSSLCNRLNYLIFHCSQTRTQSLTRLLFFLLVLCARGRDSRCQMCVLWVVVG